MNTVDEISAELVLNRLHKDAKNDYRRMGKGMIKSIFSPMRPSDFEHAYLPISKEQGHEIRKLIIDNDCKRIVEFGTSFGISTIYLADAARHTGGRVVTTELLRSKVQTALKNIENAGLIDFVEVREGDAMLTLKESIGPIDFLFLDGWKDLYLPLFKMLEPHFHTGTLIYADNMDMPDTKTYADYILKKKESYINRIIYGGKAFLTLVK